LRAWHACWCQVNELQTELSAAEQSHKDESARTAAELEEFKELVASLRGEVGRLSEQLRRVSAERDGTAKQAHRLGSAA
jgi:predicted nuclease with TOPRIM domain